MCVKREESPVFNTDVGNNMTNDIYSESLDIEIIVREKCGKVNKVSIRRMYL